MIILRASKQIRRFFSLFAGDNIETDKRIVGRRRKRKMRKATREREEERERGGVGGSGIERSSEIFSHISADFNGAGNEPQPAAVHFNELPFKCNFIMARQTNGHTDRETDSWTAKTDSWDSLLWNCQRKRVVCFARDYGNQS